MIVFTVVVAMSSIVLSSADGGVYKTSYMCSGLDGVARWTAETEIFAGSDDGTGISVMTEKGEGFYTGYEGRVHWTAKLWFRDAAGKVSPVRMESEVFSLGGEKLSSETQSFDVEHGKVVHESRVFPGGDKRHTEFRAPGDMANRLILGMYVRDMLEAGDTSRTVYMLNSEPSLYKLTIRVVGRESIEVGGRVRDTFKLCLDPELGFLSFVKIILPKAYVWHSAKPGFEWLRYKGVEETLESPEVEINSLD